MLDKDRLYQELGELESIRTDNKERFRFHVIEKDGLQIVYFTITSHHINYEFEVTFPYAYPSIPPVIKQKTIFPTKHKYTNDVMCLKHAHDNWQPTLMLKDQVLNLFDLLDDENPLGVREKIESEVESEDGESWDLGRKLREFNKYDLLFINIQQYIALTKDKTQGTAKIYIKENRFNQEYFFFQSINEKEVYSHLKKTKLTNIMYFVFNDDKHSFEYVSKNKKILFENFQKSHKGYKGYLIVNKLDIYLLIKNSNDVKLVYSLWEENAKNERLSLSEEVKEKKIVIVGLGSVGSRVLIDLARTGFKQFVIIDHDLFFPYNVIRHELTAYHIGDFKVEALKRKIVEEINPHVKITDFRYEFAGQESTSYTNLVVTEIMNADIIVDCSGNNSVLSSLDELVLEYNLNYVAGTILPAAVGQVIFIRKKESSYSLIDIYHRYSEFIEATSIDIPKQKSDYTGLIGETIFSATMSDCSILSGFIGKIVMSLLDPQNIADFSKPFYLLSTSNIVGLDAPMSVLTISDAMIPVQRKELEKNNELIEMGKKIYDNRNSKTYK